MLSSTDISAPPKFKEEYDEMCDEYEKACLVDFAGKRMLTKEMWERRYKLHDVTDPNDNARAIYQFHYDYHFDNNELLCALLPKRKICDLDWDFETIGYAWGEPNCEHTAYEDLCYPQMDLGEKYLEYEKWVACSFLPKPDNIERLKEMYLKIKSVEADPAKWVEALMEANDHDFVCHNIEYRLGGNLDNKILWLIYIDYLKIHDCQKLLQTYSKYIRFFLEDEDMVDEYHEAVQKYGPVLVPWKNTHDFETFDEHFFEKEAPCQSYQRTFPVESPPSLPRFNAENAVTQYFPFFTKTMIYIRENASAEVLLKLYKTCKFFHARFPKTLCYKVEVDDDSVVPFTIKNLHLKVTNEWLTNTHVDDIFIGNVFICKSKDPTALSKIIPKIYQCSAKFIEICDQKFSLDDLKALIGHGNVLELTLCSPENNNGNCLIMEDILQMTPCIKKFRFDNRIQCTAETAKNLCEMEFKNKMQEIRLNLTNDLLDPHDFAKFIMKNCLPDAFIRIYFTFDGKEIFLPNFKKILDDVLQTRCSCNKCN